MQGRLARRQAPAIAAQAAAPQTQAQRTSMTRHTPQARACCHSRMHHPTQLLPTTGLRALPGPQHSLGFSLASSRLQVQQTHVLTVPQQVPVSRMSHFRRVTHSLPRLAFYQLLQQHLQQLPPQLMQGCKRQVRRDSGPVGGGGPPGTLLQRQGTAAQGRAASRSPGGNWIPG